MFDFISIPFTEDEVNFIRSAFPSLSTVEAVRLAAMVESARRMKEITDAEKLLRDYRAANHHAAEPVEAHGAAGTPLLPLSIDPKREIDIEIAADRLRGKMNAKSDAKAEAWRREQWGDLPRDSFNNLKRKHDDK